MVVVVVLMMGKEGWVLPLTTVAILSGRMWNVMLASTVAAGAAAVTATAEMVSIRASISSSIGIAPDEMSNVVVMIHAWSSRRNMLVVVVVVVMRRGSRDWRGRVFQFRSAVESTTVHGRTLFVAEPITQITLRAESASESAVVVVMLAFAPYGMIGTHGCAVRSS